MITPPAEGYSVGGLFFYDTNWCSKAIIIAEHGSIEPMKNKKYKKFRVSKDNREHVVMLVNYHTLKLGESYQVFGEGIDWYKVRNRGKIIYVFKSLVE